MSIAQTLSNLPHIALDDNGEPIIIPHAARTDRCDACENLFMEILVCATRFTFPCGHVFCQPCLASFQARARAQPPQPTKCPRCPNFIVRAWKGWKCEHPINFVEFHLHDYTIGAHLVDLRYKLNMGQYVTETCQRCFMAGELRKMSMKVAGDFPLGDFPGEVYACVQVNGYVVHGMVREPRYAAVDFEDDVEMPRSDLKNDDDAGQICGLIAGYPMEPHFLPLGDLTLTYRMRGFKTWLDKLPADDFKHSGLKDMLRLHREEKERREEEAEEEIVFDWD